MHRERKSDALSLISMKWSPNEVLQLFNYLLVKTITYYCTLSQKFGTSVLNLGAGFLRIFTVVFDRYFRLG